MNSVTGKEIAAILEKHGPQTGAQLLKRTNLEVFPLWRICRTTPEICFQIAGTRFLRLDRAVDGYARLSPSIQREFLTYTILAHRSQQGQLAEKAERLIEEIKRVSRGKFGLASVIMASVISDMPTRERLMQQLCVIIAGDIVHEMSHAVPRPEISTGKMVRGSDLDLVIIVSDDLPTGDIEALDDVIYKKKHYLLVHPDYKEEIDYIIKRMSHVRAQLKFNSFEAMVACKIMEEGKLLFGSAAVFQSMKDLLDQHGIPARLHEMEHLAEVNRGKAETALLETPDGLERREFQNLFYTCEEKEEIY